MGKNRIIQFLTVNVALFFPIAASGDEHKEFTGRAATRVYFLHIPKTAGTTLRLMLEAQLHEKEIYPYRNQRHPRIPVTHELVSGHFPYWLCKKMDPEFDHAFKITILREPVERYLSYLRAKKQTNENVLDLEAVMKQKKRSFWLLDNALCHNLSSDPTLEGEALLENAKQNLQQIDCVLFFNHFEEDVTELFHRLGIDLNEGYSGCRIDIPRMNTTEKEPASEALLEKIRKANELDIQLYEYAKSHLSKKNTNHQLRQNSFHELLSCSSRIDYTFDLPLNGTGWSAREKVSEEENSFLTCRWVMNMPASMYFFLKEGIDYNLYFYAKALTNEIVPRVAINGKEIPVSKISEGSFATYQGKIPREYITDLPATLSFFSSKSYKYIRGLPPLAFALNRIQIVEAP